MYLHTHLHVNEKGLLHLVGTSDRWPALEIAAHVSRLMSGITNGSELLIVDGVNSLGFLDDENEAAIAAYRVLADVDGEVTVTTKEFLTAWAAATDGQKLTAAVEAVSTLLKNYAHLIVNSSDTMEWSMVPGWYVVESGGLAHGDFPTDACEAMRNIWRQEWSSFLQEAVGVADGPLFRPEDVNALVAAVADDSVPAAELRERARNVLQLMDPRGLV